MKRLSSFLIKINSINSIYGSIALNNRRYSIKDSLQKHGRIIKGIGGLYYIDTDEGIFFCRAKGLFRKLGVEPIIGDFVTISVISSQLKEGIILEISPRFNQLLRPKVSNINQSVLVFSTTDPPINLDLLDRLTILSEEQDLNVIIVLNKIDKLPYSKVKEIYEKIGYCVIYTSVIKKEGLDKLVTLLNGKVTVFCGPSGVGKSSLINCIVPDAYMEVGEISQKGKRGRHTTRFSKLIKTENGYIVDSPGFSSLNLNFEKKLLAKYFREFLPYINNCRFKDCNHIQEPDCNVKQNVPNVITKERYERYVTLYKELNK